MATVITEERRQAFDLALGLKKFKHDELSVDEQMYILQEILKKYCTREMLPFKPLWDLASKRASDITGFGRTHDGERILSREVVLATGPLSVSKGAMYWILQDMLSLPEPVKAEFWGPEDRERNEPPRPKAGEEYESEALLVGPQGNMLHWKAAWKAELCSQYQDISERKYAERAISWRATKSELSPLSDSVFAAHLGGESCRAFHRLLWQIDRGLTDRRRDLERRLERFNEREQSFYETVASFSGPKRH